MISLVINGKEIETVTSQMEKVKISNPTSTSYTVGINTKHANHSVFCRITIRDKVVLGRIEVATEDGKTYKGQIVYQEN